MASGTMVLDYTDILIAQLKSCARKALPWSTFAFVLAWRTDMGIYRAVAECVFYHHRYKFAAGHSLKQTYLSQNPTKTDKITKTANAERLFGEGDFV